MSNAILVKKRLKCTHIVIEFYEHVYLNGVVRFDL